MLFRSPKNQSKEKNIVRQNIRILEETFASFNIKATVERAEIGPSVTKYEVKPAVGVRVNRISNLADDLALALAAKDVRIEAPIPGKSLVGIEVPNSEIATVSFRELWEQSKTDPAKLLEIPLGKAVDGSARTFDLARMPHLLVAGSTGSGKSVAVNGIISSILMKARPDEVKFMMVDPKMVRESVPDDTAKATREGTLALIKPEITSTDGRWVARIMWIPAARAFCPRRIIASSTSLLATIIKSANSSTMTTINGRGTCFISDWALYSATLALKPAILRAPTFEKSS